MTLLHLKAFDIVHHKGEPVFKQYKGVDPGEVFLVHVCEKHYELEESADD